MDKLITTFEYEPTPDHHHPGSGRYGLRITLHEDISQAMPYLNAVMKDTDYSHENHILIGRGYGNRYAFRSNEIRLAEIPDVASAEACAKAAVDMVNKVWADRANITPSTKQRKQPPVYDIFKLLPRNNCKRCGYATCLAYASDLRNAKATLDQCPALCEPQNAASRERIVALF